MVSAADVAWAVPDALVAVTVHDTDLPASPSSGVNAIVVPRSTPATRQTRPNVGAGVPFQTPSEQVSDEPARAEPLIVGIARIVGAVLPPPPPPATATRIGRRLHGLAGRIGGRAARPRWRR